jgi:SAM-dependent methyltransferase
VSKQSSNCTVCGRANLRYRHDWLYRCSACGFRSSSLDILINDSEIDEGKREFALHDLRRENFETVLDWLEEAGLKRSDRILEVGCGHGWFLAAAKARGYRSVGIEPDKHIATIALAKGFPVKVGYFPDVVEPGEEFDAIVFNDVFEHLPDPLAALKSVRSCLTPSGIVAINLPVATGIFYRSAELFDRFGSHGPLERMWQLSFPSPHRSYFSAEQLSALAARCGFIETMRRSLPSLRIRGLWQRLRYDPAQSMLSAAFMWLPLVALVPLLRLFPQDIGVQFFEPLTEKES